LYQLKLPSFTVKKYAVIYTLFQLLLEIYPKISYFQTVPAHILQTQQGFFNLV